MEAMTGERFEDLQDVSPHTRRAIAKVFKYTTMTKVQAQTIQPCLSGVDVIAKAKTGTGKTLGFLIPAIESLVRSPPPKGHISVLVLAPTRELAQQTAKEARVLLTFHSSSLGVQCVVGGTNINTEKSRLRGSPPPAVLVATPGRLNDHLENSGLARLCEHLRVLVFDEADRLLDMGFRPQIDQILRMLPSKETRQTLLFSATFPQKVDSISKVALRQGEGEHLMIDTVGEEQVATHSIPQSCLVTSLEEQITATMCVLRKHARKPDHKVIVFLPVARTTQLFAGIFNALADAGVFKKRCIEIHSRKSQSHRERASEQFRKATEGILISSDVSARGLDYPNVTFVLQSGMPSDRETYVHRLGRTARAGNSGAGLLVLADFEKDRFMREVRDLPIKHAEAIDEAELTKMRSAIEDALSKPHAVDHELRRKAYQGWLGYYNLYCKKLGLGKEELVEKANRFALDCMKCEQVPVLEKRTVGKMGLKGTRGLVVS